MSWSWASRRAFGPDTSRRPSPPANTSSWKAAGHRTYPACRDLAAGEEAKKKGLKVAVGLQRRVEPMYLDTIKKIQDGTIGKLIFLRAYWNGGPPAKRPFARGDLGELAYQICNWSNT